MAGVALASVIDRSAAARPAARPFGRWVLALVVLSYAPDIFAQLGLAAGVRIATVVGHSVVAAVAAAALAAHIARRDRWRVFTLVLGVLALHDAMDVLQSPGRMPFWPIAFRLHNPPWIPSDLAGEVLSCAPFMVLAVAFRLRAGRFWVGSGRDWAALAAVGAIALSATGTSSLRSRRVRDLSRARMLAEAGDYRAALEACATADRWPSPASPGRVDYVRAMAWWGLGERATAEALYLRAYEADPDYVWTVGDLALFHASGPGSNAERRSRAEPWLRLLRTRFAVHPAVPRLLGRIDEALGDGPGSAPPSGDELR